MPIFGPWQTGTPSENSSELEEYLKKLGLDEEKIADLQRQLNALREFKEWNYGQPKSVTSGSSDRVQPRPAPKEEQVPLKQEVPPRRYRGFWDKVSPEDLHSEETKGFRDLTMKEVPEAARVFGKAAVGALPLATVASGAIADDVARDIEQVLKATPSTPNIPKGGKTLQEFLKVREEDPWGVLAKSWIGEPDEVVERNKAANFLGQIIGSFPLALSAVRPFVQAGAPLAKKAITIGISNTVENLPMATVIALNSGDKSTAEKTVQVVLQSALTLSASTLLGIPFARRWQPDPGPTRLDLGPETGTPLQQRVAGDRATYALWGERQPQRLNEGRATIPRFSGADEIASAIREAPGILGIQRKIDAEVAKQGEPIIAERGESKLEQLIPPDDAVDPSKVQLSPVTGEPLPQTLRISPEYEAINKQYQQTGRIDEDGANIILTEGAEPIRATLSGDDAVSKIREDPEFEPIRDSIRSFMSLFQRPFRKKVTDMPELLDRVVAIVNDPVQFSQVIKDLSSPEPKINATSIAVARIAFNRVKEGLFPFLSKIALDPSDANILAAKAYLDPNLGIIRAASNSFAEWGKAGKALQEVDGSSLHAGSSTKLLKDFDLGHLVGKPEEAKRLAKILIESIESPYPETMIDFMKGRHWADSTVETLNATRKNFMLSGPRTWATTVKSNLAMIALQLAKTPVRGIVDAILRTTGKVIQRSDNPWSWGIKRADADGKTVTIEPRVNAEIVRDTAGHWLGTMLAFPRALKNYGHAIQKMEQLTGGETIIEAKRLPGFFNWIRHLGQGVLGADTFSRTMVTQGLYGSRAMSKAEGGRGLSGAELVSIIKRETERGDIGRKALNRLGAVQKKLERGEELTSKDWEDLKNLVPEGAGLPRMPVFAGSEENLVSLYRQGILDAVRDPEVKPSSAEDIKFIADEADKAAYMNETWVSKMAESLTEWQPLLALRPSLEGPQSNLRVVNLAKGFLSRIAEGRPLDIYIPFRRAQGSVFTRAIKVGTAPIWAVPVMAWRFSQVFDAAYGNRLLDKAVQRQLGTGIGVAGKGTKAGSIGLRELDLVAKPFIYHSIGQIVWMLADLGLLTKGAPLEERGTDIAEDPEAGPPRYAYRISEDRWFSLDRLDDAFSSILKMWLDIRSDYNLFHENLERKHHGESPGTLQTPLDHKTIENLERGAVDHIVDTMQRHAIDHTFFSSFRDFIDQLGKIFDERERYGQETTPGAYLEDIAREGLLDFATQFSPKVVTQVGAEGPTKHPYSPDFPLEYLESQFSPPSKRLSKRDIFGKRITGEPPIEQITGIRFPTERLDPDRAIFRDYLVPVNAPYTDAISSTNDKSIELRDQIEAVIGSYAKKSIESLRTQFDNSKEGGDVTGLPHRTFSERQKQIKDTFTGAKREVENFLIEQVINKGDYDLKKSVSFGARPLSPTDRIKQRKISRFEEAQNEADYSIPPEGRLKPGLDSLVPMVKMLYNRYGAEKYYETNVKNFLKDSILTDLGKPESKTTPALRAIIDDFEKENDSIASRILGKEERVEEERETAGAFGFRPVEREGLKDLEKENSYMNDFLKDTVYPLAIQSAKADKDLDEVEELKYKFLAFFGESYRE